MIRTFETHKIRESKELSDCLWNFHTLSGVQKDKTIQVPVPSCWETYPDTVSYRGKASYSRTFEAEGNVRLEFKGVSHTATVLVDGREVASHYNAYTIFDVLLKDMAPGVHTLEVIADNSFGPESALHVPNDYQSYGGISRPVVLDSLKEAYIQWMHITPIWKEGDEASEEEDEWDDIWSGTNQRTKTGWYLKVEVCLSNLSEEDFSGALELTIKEVEHDRTGIDEWEEEENFQYLPLLPVRLQAGETRVLRTEDIFCPGVKTWWPEQPNLYEIAAILRDDISSPIDDLIDRTGFREVKTEGKDILLNGKKLFIKGFCRHEDHPQFGCALPFSAIQYDLMLAKDLGANSIRTSHYPNDEIFLDLCDEQGILVWEENHARGLSEQDMRNPHFEKQCEDCIREMIMAHYNHPSIYIWGILNECASHTEYGKRCYEAQYELIRTLDATRPRSSASCQFKTDLCFGYPEVVSYNIYPKWYHDTPVKEYLSDLYDWVQTDTEGAGKPFLITETGAGAIYGYRTPTHVKWSEEYQVDALEQQIQAVFEQEGCSGIYIWQFCDVRVCDSWFDKRPRTMNNKGIVDEYRRPKLSYETVKNLFESKGNYR